MYLESRVSVVYHVRVFVCVYWRSLFCDSHDRSYVDSLLSSYLLPVCLCVQLYTYERILANIGQVESFTKFLHWGKKKIPVVRAQFLGSLCLPRAPGGGRPLLPSHTKKKSRTTHTKQDGRGKKI